MSTPRSSHTCEVMDGLIYVVGGGDGKDWLCSAQVRSKNNFLPLSKSAKTQSFSQKIQRSKHCICNHSKSKNSHFLLLGRLQRYWLVVHNPLCSRLKFYLRFSGQVFFRCHLLLFVFYIFSSDPQQRSIGLK